MLTKRTGRTNVVSAFDNNWNHVKSKMIKYRMHSGSPWTQIITITHINKGLKQHNYTQNQNKHRQVFFMQVWRLSWWSYFNLFSVRTNLDLTHIHYYVPDITLFDITVVWYYSVWYYCGLINVSSTEIDAVINDSVDTLCFID